MAAVIVFDVNETLLDMSALDPQFERAFGRAEARSAWFQQLKELWLVALVTKRFTPFAELADAALQMVADTEGVAIGEQQRAAIVGGMKELPPHADVREALDLLRDAGLPLATLTNGGLAAARVQLDYAGLSGHFDAIMSAEEAQAFKPARDPYEMAANRLDVTPGQMRLVAAHAWDIAGASAAGCATGYLARPGKVLNPAGPAPDLQSGDLVDLARQIARIDHARPH